MRVKEAVQQANSKLQTPNSQLQTHSSYPPVEGAFSEEDLLAARLKVTKVLPFQQTAPPYINNLFLAAMSGLLLVLAFPNWNLWSLGWVGTAPLIMAVAREQRFWRSFGLGWTTGTIFYAGTSHWITYSMHNYGGIPLWLSYLLLLLAAAMIGWFTGLFAGVLGLAIKHFGGWMILAAPLLWAASEWLRLAVSGLGWNALGYSQAFQYTLIQTARFGGVYLVSAFLVAMSAAIVFSLIYLGYRRGWVVLSVAFLLAMAMVFDGLGAEPVKTPAHDSVTVVAIQPNIPVDGDWGNEKFFEQMLLRHIALSETHLASDDAPGDQAKEADKAPESLKKGTLVIWPESPISFQYEKDPALQKALAAFTRRHQVYLLINSWGVPRQGDAADAVYNSALLIAPDGALASRYDKMALMPFGEYVPARGLIPFMERIPALVADTTAGSRLTIGEAAGAKFSTLICYEAMRPDLAREARRQGATGVIQLSNEAWFGPYSMARQMLAQAVFRAVENHTPVLRVTNSGASAGVTEYGAVFDETPLFQTATRLWSLPTADGWHPPPTFYTRHGDLFVIACALLGGVLLLASVVQEIRKRREEKEDKEDND